MSEAIYSASLTRICRHVLVLRLHEGPNGRYGDPFIWTCLIEDRSLPWWRRLWRRLRGRPVERVAFMAAALTAPPQTSTEVIFASLRAGGFTCRVYERWRKGQKRLVEAPL